MARLYILPLQQCRYLLEANTTSLEVIEEGGLVPASLAHLSASLGYMKLWLGLFDDSKADFEVALEFDRFEEGENWPEGERAIDLLSVYALTYHKTGNLVAASEGMQAAVAAAQLQYGSHDPRTNLLLARSEFIAERQETLLEHHKAVVIASNGPKRQRSGQRISSVGMTLGRNLATPHRGHSFMGNLGRVDTLPGYSRFPQIGYYRSLMDHDGFPRKYDHFTFFSPHYPDTLKREAFIVRKLGILSRLRAKPSALPSNSEVEALLVELGAIMESVGWLDGAEMAYTCAIRLEIYDIKVYEVKRQAVKYQTGERLSEEVFSIIDDLTKVLRRQLKDPIALKQHRGIVLVDDPELEVFEVLKDNAENTKWESLEDIAKNMEWPVEHYRTGRDFLTAILDQKLLILGKENPSTLQSMETLGQMYMRAKDWRHAAEVYRGIIILEAQTNTAVNQLHLVDLHMFGKALFNLKAYDEAQDVFQKALNLSVTILGPQAFNECDEIFQEWEKCMKVQGKEEEHEAIWAALFDRATTTLTRSTGGPS